MLETNLPTCHSHRQTLGFGRQQFDFVNEPWPKADMNTFQKSI